MSEILVADTRVSYADSDTDESGADTMSGTETGRGNQPGQGE